MTKHDCCRDTHGDARGQRRKSPRRDSGHMTHRHFVAARASFTRSHLAGPQLSKESPKADQLELRKPRPGRIEVGGTADLVTLGLDTPGLATVDQAQAAAS